MRGVTSVIVQTHQILRLPRKMNLMIDPCHTWNAIYNARSNKCHCPNSPNTAPATQNDSPKFPRYLSKTDETSVPMRDRSENDPSRIRPQNRQSATRLATEVTFRAHHEHFPLKNTTFRAPAIIPNFTKCCTCHKKWRLNFTKYCACHGKWLSWLILVTYETSFTMRGATEVFLQRHRILRLPHKVTLMIDPHDAWNVIYNARSNRGVSPTSPNTAPATQNDSHDWSAWHMKRHLQCAEQQRCFSNITEYCACHTKWLSWLIRMTYENVIYNAQSNRCHPPTSPNIAPATKNDPLTFHRNFSKTAETSFTMRDRSENDPSTIRPQNRQSATRLATEVTFRAHHERFLLKNTTFRAPAIIPNFTKCCTCHEKWPLNFTKYCACHEKWHLNFTKDCTCHEKWHLKFTK